MYGVDGLPIIGFKVIISHYIGIVMMSKSTADFLSLITDDFGFQRGHALPLGATIERGGINFSIYARYATEVVLVFFLPGEDQEIAAFPLDGKFNRTGDVWHAFISGLNPGVEYAYKIDGLVGSTHRYNANLLLADPYAVALNGRLVWGKIMTSHPLSPSCLS